MCLNFVSIIKGGDSREINTVIESERESERNSEKVPFLLNSFKIRSQKLLSNRQ